MSPRRFVNGFVANLEMPKRRFSTTFKSLGIGKRIPWSRLGCLVDETTILLSTTDHQKSFIKGCRRLETQKGLLRNGSTALCGCIRSESDVVASRKHDCMELVVYFWISNRIGILQMQLDVCNASVSIWGGFWYNDTLV